MKKSSSQKLNLGIFTIISTFILIAALYIIGNRQNLFGNTFKINSVFNNVNGLMLGNNVRYSGINVGTVKNITMLNDTTISVEMNIESKILKHIKKNAIAIIGSDGLVGSMVINIIPGKDASVQLKSGDTIKSFSKISTNDMLTTLNTTNENAALLTADLLKITTAINDSKGTVGLLINDVQMASNLKQTIVNLKTASSNASEAMRELNNILSLVNYDKSLAAVLLSDSIATIKMKSILINLDKSSEGIDSIITNLNDVVLTIKKGKGTLNHMINDTVLVNNIDKTIKNIKKGSLLLNEDLEALKHNFLLRRYFKKLEKNKLK